MLKHKIIIIMIAALFVTTNVHAVALGVNRASIEYYGVLRGGYAEERVIISTDSEDIITSEIRLEGEAADWISFSNKNFEFSRNSPYELIIKVQPPMDARIQEYYVNMSILTGELYREGGERFGTATRASCRIPITINLTGNERVECIVGGVQVLDTERGQPVEVKISVTNKGNVRINPALQIEVWDKFRAKSMGKKDMIFGSNILPTTTLQQNPSTQIDLMPEQYWATITVPDCKYATTTTFDVLEPGGIKDDGELLRLEAPAWTNTGNITQINAIFRNRGVRGVTASFKGTISNVDTNEIVKVIDSVQYTVGPDTTAEIPAYFNPEVGGRYEVRGKVYYNSKLTTEKSLLINVNGGPVQYSSMSWTPIIIIVIIIIILVLLILIKRRTATAQYSPGMRR